MRPPRDAGTPFIVTVIARAVLLLTAAATQACGLDRAHDRARSCCVDLLAALPQADIRPIHRAPDAVRAVEIDVNGQRTRALSVSVPARVVFTLRIPARAAFSTSLSVEPRGTADAGNSGVVFRVGIVDDRIYEQLLEHTVHARAAGSWTPVRVDLASYAGWQWSLFYRPWEIDWHLVLNAYPLGQGSEPSRGLWLKPLIVDAKMEVSPDEAASDFGRRKGPAAHGQSGRPSP